MDSGVSEEDGLALVPRDPGEPHQASQEGAGAQQRVRIYFPDDQDWYEAVVMAHDPRTRRSKLMFLYDGEVRCPSCIIAKV